MQAATYSCPPLTHPPFHSHKVTTQSIYLLAWGQSIRSGDILNEALTTKDLLAFEAR
jgi:hypothetical protein